MNEANTATLHDKYPSFFKGPYHADGAIPFECEDGWFNLIDNLCANLTNEIKNKRYGLIEDMCYATQIKEKYGKLRFYMSTTTNSMDSLIEFAEALSAVTCELCGAPGKIIGTAWYKCRCESCKDVSKGHWVKE